MSVLRKNSFFLKKVAIFKRIYCIFALKFIENMKSIPNLVRKAAEGRKFLGGRVEFLCYYNNKEVYSYKYEEDEQVNVGFPEFYVWDGKHCDVIGGFDALDLLGKLDFEE